VGTWFAGIAHGSAACFQCGSFTGTENTPQTRIGGREAVWNYDKRQLL
jgi:hypothetical protein